MDRKVIEKYFIRRFDVTIRIVAALSPRRGVICEANDGRGFALAPLSVGCAASSPKGRAKRPLSHRLRGDSSPINGGAFGAVFRA